ncbi:hypothetical protein B0H63DRAFT_494970 [Podospora didyma]|uniref:ceramidase n=1 Tax=Podospora didyma TaxID=330526 RepID=A0AAE0NGL2_9PEZI|nr:hypothetical protein B0H63DRAFT_494970 [Podospora didyma]
MPPAQRYAHVVPAMKPTIDDTNLEGVFSDLVEMFLPDRPFAQRCVYRFARLVLRRLYTDEETDELRGISAATGLPMFLLVAFNVLLDLLLGCTSGGVRYQESGTDKESRMVHFRTLDWDMDPLRMLIVELDFIRAPGGPVVATTIGYFGYVGVLTGVRQGLSMSLNFRPTHDRSSWWKRAAFRWHQAMVVLGRRPSISSNLRHWLLCTDKPGKEPLLRRRQRKPSSSPPSLLHDDDKTQAANDTDELDKRSGDMTDFLLNELFTSNSTAAYIILCTPQLAYSVEKDHRSASIRTHLRLLTTCNHDLSDEADPAQIHEAAKHVTDSGMQALVEDSLSRKTKVSKIWKRRLQQRRTKQYQQLRHRQTTATSQKIAGGELAQQPPPPPQQPQDQNQDDDEKDPDVADEEHEIQGVALHDVLRMLGDRDISNDQTHYAVVMDPRTGGVLWRRVYQLGEL